MAPVTRKFKTIAPAPESSEIMTTENESVSSKSTSPTSQSEYADTSSNYSHHNYPTRNNKNIDLLSESYVMRTNQKVSTPVKSVSPKPSSQKSKTSSIGLRHTKPPRKTMAHVTSRPKPSDISHESPPHILPATDARTSPDTLKKMGPENHHIHQSSQVSDATGVITPGLLAKHHLPGILLNHGPLAIRHIMSCLTIAVPGFSGISPTKARRLVVSALVSRTNEDMMDNYCDDIIFEKVGWGRWHARLKSREVKALDHGIPPSGLSITGTKNHYKYDRTRLKSSCSSWPDHSTFFSQGDSMDVDTDIIMTENDTDKISYGGNETCSSSPPSLEALNDDDDDDDDDEIMSDEYDESSDTTDDEDWASLGAAALRAASYSTCSNTSSFLSPTYGSRVGGGPRLSTLTKPCSKPNLITNIDLSAFDLTSNPQEREAIEALLRLGSV